MLRQLEVIGAAWGLGGADPGCAEAADVLAPLVVEKLARCGAEVSVGPVVRHESSDRRKAAVVAKLCGALAAAVADALRRGRLPCVLGGDHSCAGGTWSGAARALHGPLGLLWIDAHMDSHTPRTSHTGRLHGMPLAWLLGEDDDPLYGLTTGVLDPRHVCLLGVRSYEPEEDERLRRLGVRVMLVEEVARRGLGAALEEGLAIATGGTRAYGVSIDLDVVTPDEAPGVGTPVAGGPGARELAGALTLVARTPNLAAIELVEYSPRRDASRRTAQVAVELLAAALCGRTGDDSQVLAQAVQRYDP
ncbi:MAG TPA: arginase [Burkholderiales bacterium]|nr:arginase [Burkholderiales bacterium]